MKHHRIHYESDDQAFPADAYRVRGGNQSDSVCDTWVAKDRLVGCRWPMGAPVTGQKINLTGTGELSKNEA